MLEDFRLKVFLEVASRKNFTKAADVLSVSQPAVSKHISELERILGVRLFVRQKGEMLLTPEGQVFVSYAERILSGYSFAELMFSPLDECLVRVSASEDAFDFLIREVLADFSTIHRQITFVRSSEEPDIIVSVCAVENKKGMFALSAHPSESFSVTRLWSVLSQVLEPALK